MSKGSARRPGSNYADNWAKIFSPASPPNVPHQDGSESFVESNAAPFTEFTRLSQSSQPKRSASLLDGIAASFKPNMES